MKKFLLIISTILLAFGAYIFVRNDSIFLFYGDNVDQLIPFYNHLTDLIRNNSLSFWDHSVGFGSNLFIFFFNAPLGSPFLYLLLLFEPDFIPYSFFVSLLIRFFFTAIFSYLWISKLTKKETSRIILALIYTFSGWMLYWIHYNTTLDFYMYIPLILYLSEEVLENRKRLLFVFTVGLAAISSLYYFYIFAWILFIYHTLRHLTGPKPINTKTYFSAFFKLLPWFLLGLSLVSFILLPNIAIILSSPRFSGTQDALFSFDLSFIKIYSFFTSFFSPVLSDYDTNIYASRVLNNQVFLNYFYSFLIFPLSLPLFIFIKEKKKWTYIVILSLLYLASFIPFFSILFNGNIDRRWQLILLIMNIVTLAYILEHSFSRMQVLFSFLLTLAVLYLLTTTSLSNKLFSQENLPSMKQIVYSSIFILILYTWYLMEFKFKNIVIIVVLVIESLFSLYHRTHINNSPRYIVFDQFDASKYYANEAIPYITIRDTDSYRIEDSQAMANDPINYSYSGVTFYSSVYNHSTRSTLDNRFSPGWNSGYVESKFLFKHLLNTKYHITNGNGLTPYGYSYWDQIGDDLIYRSDFNIGIGFASTKIININEFEQFTKVEQDLLLFQAIVSNKTSTIHDFYLGQSLSKETIDPQISIPSEEGFIFMDYSKSNPYTECSIDKYNGDSLLKQEYRNEYGYTMIKNDLGLNRAFLYCRFIYNSNESIPIDVSFVSNNDIDELFQQVERYDSFYDVQTNGNRINAKIKISNDDSLVFMNIPYDKGWTLKVNGEVLDIEIVNQSFIGYMLNKGEYQIELVFTPYLFKEGMIISSFSLALLLLLLNKKRALVKLKTTN